MRKVRSPLTMFHIVVLLLSIYYIFILFMFESNRLDNNKGNVNSRNDNINLRYNSMIAKTNVTTTRIAMIVLYMGYNSTALPTYFNIFLSSIAGASSRAALQSPSCIIDYYIFTIDDTVDGTVDDTVDDIVDDNGVTLKGNNIKIIKICKQDIIKNILTLDSSSSSITSEAYKELYDIADSLITTNPYSLIEFKPCYGYWFSEYVKQYNYWGYIDADTVVSGNINRMIHAAITKYDFDVYTSRYRFVYTLILSYFHTLIFSY